MKTFKKLLSAFTLFVLSIAGLSNLNFALAAPSDTGNPYAEPILNTIDDQSLGVIVPDAVTDQTGEKLFNQQVLKLIDYAIDVFIVIGIAIAFFGAYKIMFSDKEDAFKEGIRLIVYGLLGVIIMVSAKFIAGTLIDNLGTNLDRTSISGIKLASDLYENLLYPFIKVALYLVVGALFIMMAIKVVSFIISTDDVAKKKAGGIILWCAIGILIVMGSKQIVEGIMGKEDAIVNTEAGEINEIGNQIWAFESAPIIAQVINWIMGLSMFVVLVLIIIQAYRMFAKPDDPKNRERLKKTLLYIVIGVLVIGASYIISTVLVVDNIPIETVTG